jgi:poly-gamma-glutamate synthesis protein (capsule biosynthesis protein)
LTSDEEVIELVAVGDVMLGRDVIAEPGVFRAVTPWLRASDVAMGNLECVVTGDTRLWPAGSHDDLGGGKTGFALHAPPRAAAHLRWAGFDILGLANNHALDLGSAGLAETASRLQAVGIASIGAGSDPEAALQATVHDIDGVRLAFLAFNAVSDGREAQVVGWTRAGWDVEQVTAAVSAARDRADAVIVSVHWGYEYQTRVDPAQRVAADLLLRAGADLVIGHHPHVVQAFEMDGGRGVAYSLGNFVFDQGQGETGKGLALRAFFDRHGLRAVQALPVWAGARPHLMAPEAAETLLARVSTPQRSQFACRDGPCRRVDAPRQERVERPSTLFWGGRVDLTGDGVPEHVRRVNKHVAIYSDDVRVWQTPTGWRVVDVALGDPNDDGRGEILLALWKPGLDGLEPPSPDKERIPRSHPFIVGYRGGIYRTLWGGSAVSDPIYEVELGDVDGDAVQELVVLDGDDPHRCTISVWRWHGWGFSLVWRSDPGAYQGLSLSEDGIISVVLE